MINSDTCPQNVRGMRATFGHKWDDVVSFRRVRSLFFNDLRGKRLAPKAEVTGSNPVGCANIALKYKDKLFKPELGFVIFAVAHHLLTTVDDFTA